MTPWHDVSYGDFQFFGFVVLVLLVVGATVLGLAIAVIDGLQRRRAKRWRDGVDERGRR